MKKKIAFVLDRFVVGGVEKSFLDLLDNIDRNKIDVTVYLPDEKGEWTHILQEKCEVRFLRIEEFKTLLKEYIVKFDVINAIRCLFYRCLARYTYKRNYRKSTEFFIKSMRRENREYDCVVAYQIINDDCVLGSLYRIKGKKKIVWSHAYINKNEKIYEQWYNKFDKVFCVSNYAKNAFIKNFPNLESKTELFYNIINSEKIKQMSEEKIENLNARSEKVIVTVGRLSKEKGQMVIPEVVNKLRERGFDIKWYLIGDGDLRSQLEQQIETYKLDEQLFLLGNKENPYPYMKNCDIYVQTSITEGWGLTVSEAKALKKVIVTTDAGVMKEQIKNGETGIIILEPKADDIARAIINLLENEEIGNRFIEQLEKEDVSHKKELIKLYSILNEGEH